MILEFLCDICKTIESYWIVYIFDMKSWILIREREREFNEIEWLIIRNSTFVESHFIVLSVSTDLWLTAQENRSQNAHELIIHIGCKLNLSMILTNISMIDEDFSYEVFRYFYVKYIFSLNWENLQHPLD